MQTGGDCFPLSNMFPNALNVTKLGRVGKIQNGNASCQTNCLHDTN